MSRVKTPALAMIVLFTLAGCAWMFEVNVFGALDNPPTPTAADYQGADGHDKLAEDLNSPARVQALVDSGIVDDIAAELLASIGGTVDGDEDAQAAILYADLALKTTEGEEFVNNIADAVLGGTVDGSSSVKVILEGIIPPEAYASEATFTDMVEALLAANDAYEQLGLYVDGIVTDGIHENDLPPGCEPGDLSQKAIVAYTMRVMVEAVISGLGLAGTQEEKEAAAIAQLFLVGTGGAYDPGMDTVDPDIYTGTDMWIIALLDAAGTKTLFGF
jgi:hypothetical protein